MLGQYECSKLSVFLATLGTPALQAGELELKPETLRTWDAYVHKATAAMQQRGHAAGGAGTFLWMDEDAGRVARVRAGEIVVWPVGDANPKRVPSGLIHDWSAPCHLVCGLDYILSVVRTPRYKEVYKPGVLDAKLLSQTESADRFSMLMRNGSFFTKTALDGEFDSSYVQVSETRWYSVSSPTHVREIENYGQAWENTSCRRTKGTDMTCCSHRPTSRSGMRSDVDEELDCAKLDVPAAMR